MYTYFLPSLEACEPGLAPEALVLPLSIIRRPHNLARVNLQASAARTLQVPARKQSCRH